MDNVINPYNSSRPGNAFVGYEQVRSRMMRGFRNAKSYAVLGGRRCGKTSMLMQIATDFTQERMNSYRYLPRILDMQAVVPRSPSDFFRAVYSLVMQDISDTSVDLHNYQDFLALLTRSQPLIEQKYGANWVMVLLIDELESAVTTLP